VSNGFYIDYARDGVRIWDSESRDSKILQGFERERKVWHAKESRLESNKNQVRESELYGILFVSASLVSTACPGLYAFTTLSI